MPYLLLPGPVTTTQQVKFAALADHDPSGPEFRQIVADTRARVLALCNANVDYDCVLLPGSGVLANECALASFAPARGYKTLVITNGEHGERAANILQRLGLPYLRVDRGETASPTAEEIHPLLHADKTITHVWLVHCESASGIINPVGEIGAMVRSLGRKLIVDATASLGALPVNVGDDNIDILVSESSVCIQGLPGVSFVVAQKELLNASMGRPQSFAHDIFEEWRCLETTGRFRFQPPTQAVAALHRALQELADEGGTEARRTRYERNAQALVTGLRRLGFTTLLDENTTGPIVQTVLAPADKSYSFKTFAAELRARGFAIAPGRLAKHASFRIGTAGHLDEEQIETFLESLADVVRKLDLKDLQPHLATE